jgi:hypothetical protein
MEAENEGMSKKKKVATGAAVGLATTAAVGVAKKLMSDDGDEGTTRGRTTASTSRARSGSRPTRPTRSARSTTKRTSGEKTKEQLYSEAKRLDISGRSKMNKTQLKRAVARARS